MQNILRFLKDKRKALILILLFYAINFGLWELIAPIVSGEWASFIVYALLFTVVLLLFAKDLKNEWNELKSCKLRGKKFWIELIIWLAAELILTTVLLAAANKFKPDVLPQNNESVKNQMTAIPVILTVIQGCVFAPVIEEMIFRYSIIGKPQTKIGTAIAFAVSVILFDCIHIVRFPEFFYYLLPSIVLTAFYTRHKNVFASVILHSAINVAGYAALIAGLL